MPQKPTFLTYPIGGAAAERMENRGLVAYLDHAVLESDGPRLKAVCGVLTSSLCMDSSLATTTPPDCPRCVAKLKRMGLIGD